MTKLVIDASVAMKWVIGEDGTAEALTLLRKAELSAPDLLVAECANIIWKKVQKRELKKDEALLIARLLEKAEVELLPTRTLLEPAARMAIELGHPAYDCVYLSLAIENNRRFVTADARFLRKLEENRAHRFRDAAISLSQAARELQSASPGRNE
ncbi:MAG TPA: type II toxin-antitoxin system VapC family toxin [Candidatus Binataceae bacterium]|nr:type II toxin-antitoxin system VapC family toxin [Candidatus Binataceae bacterium]